MAKDTNKPLKKSEFTDCWRMETSIIWGPKHKQQNKASGKAESDRSDKHLEFGAVDSEIQICVYRYFL